MNPQEAASLFSGPRKAVNPPSNANSKRPTNSTAPEKISINNLIELKQLVERLKPGAEEEATPIVFKTRGTAVEDETFSGQVTIPQSGGQSILRKTLLEGFEMVKSHHEFHKASLEAHSMEEEYGGYLPALAPSPDDHKMWIDKFVNDRLGAKREGLYIIWEIPEGKYKFDPWSCSLEKVNA